MITETSHPKEDRYKWIRLIGEECITALQNGIPLWGVCWYPIIDRPDWDHLTPWHHAGLWDIEESKIQNGIPVRELHLPTATAFLQAQKEVAVVLENETAEMV